MFYVPVACLVAISLCVGPPLLAQNRPKADAATPATSPLAVGQEMFRTDCAPCHGLDAKGRGPAAPALKSKPTDLTQLRKRNGGEFPSAMVEGVIQGNGFVPAHGSREMPVWGDAFRNINRDEALVKIKIHHLVLYIESVQEK